MMTAILTALPLSRWMLLTSAGETLSKSIMMANGSNTRQPLIISLKQYLLNGNFICSLDSSITLDGSNVFATGMVMIFLPGNWFWF